MKNLFRIQLIAFAAILLVMCFGNNIIAQNVHADNTMSGISQSDAIKVTWKNFNRAETDLMFKSFVDMGEIGKFTHVRKPTPVDKQNVVRMNRDTQYSFAILDLTKPAEINKPAAENIYTY